MLRALALLVLAPSVAAQPARCKTAYNAAVPASVSGACWPDGTLLKECSQPCAAVFNPFWKVCRSTLMANAKDTGREGLKPFGDKCKAASIGHLGGRRACTAKTFASRKKQMEGVCCKDKRNCRGRDGLPSQCSLQCSVAFSTFYEDCTDLIDSKISAAAVRNYDRKYRSCIDSQNPAALLAVLSDMKGEGCTVGTNAAVSLESEAKFHGLHGGQVWTGHYLCPQGDTDLQIKVGEVTPSGVVHATFAFDHRKQCNGEYRVSGKIDANGKLKLMPPRPGSSSVGWLSNKCHYISVGLDGQVSKGIDGEMLYSGKILSSSCGQFLVTLPGAKPGELSCPDTSIGWQLGATTCYAQVNTPMTLTQAESYCHRLDQRAHVAKVPTMEDLEFLAQKVGETGDGKGAYLLGATCPAKDKIFCDFLDGSAVTVTPEGYCAMAKTKHRPCSEPDEIKTNRQLGVNQNGLFDGGMFARPFFCSIPPKPKPSTQCANDLSGTWEGDWVKGNTKNGEQDISVGRYVTTIMQSTSTWTQSFRLIHRKAECNSGTNAGQSTQWRKPMTEYVSHQECEDACSGNDDCNGMIEYGTGVCRQKRLNRLTGAQECAKNVEQCVSANQCKCYLVTGTCTKPSRHPYFNIFKASKHPAKETTFTATCEHKDRCYWSPAGGTVSADRSKVMMTDGFKLTGILSNDGKEIAWSNKAFWTRISECGSFGHERLPLRIPKGSFGVGSSITCNGVWPTGDTRFSLNLMAGQEILLHVNPRDGSSPASPRNVVLNSKFLPFSGPKHGWGTEQKVGSLPLRHNVPFQIRVTAGREDFRITFEGDGSVGQYGGTGQFGLLHKGMECSDGHDKDQSVPWADGLNAYVSFNQCESACLNEPRCKAQGKIEYGLMPGRCKRPDACKCYLVIGKCSKPAAHKSYSVYQLGAPEKTRSTFTYKYRKSRDAVLASIDRIASEDASIQYCDFNQAPQVPLFTKTFQGKTWTLVRRVKQGRTWHPATDELMGTDEYGTYCGQPGAASHCDTSDATFSIPFGDNGRSSLHWDQIMFSSGDMKAWLIMDKAEMDRCTDGKNNGQWHPKISKSSTSTKSYSVLQYCRRGNEEDPWISVATHPSGVVYGEGSFDVPGWCNAYGGDGHPSKCVASCWKGTFCASRCPHCDDDAIIGHGGANVWVHTISRPEGNGHRRLDTVATNETDQPPTVTANKGASIHSNNTTIGVHEDSTQQIAAASMILQRRALQSGGFGNLGGFTLPPADACPLVDLHKRLSTVNTKCCTKKSPCIGGVPKKCDIHCALEYSDFYADCAHILKETFHASAKTFDSFSRQCSSAFDLKSLIEMAATTVCDNAPNQFGNDGGSKWVQTNEKMTDWQSGQKYCAAHQLSLCPYERVCKNGAGHPPSGGTRPGDQWAPVAGTANSWVQVGTWGGSAKNTCVKHEELSGGRYGRPAWGTTSQHASYEGWVMCC